jgi:divalent metal cation (Fe/Co/Zn/Cd) transporter
VAISLVPILHWKALDPIIGLLVGLNIIRVGYQLLRRSAIGLLDAALPADEALKVTDVIDRYRRERSIDFQALRTQESGRQRFIYVDVVMPGSLTLNEAHQIAEDFTADLAAVLPGVVTFTHLEPAPEHVAPRRPGV